MYLQVLAFSFPALALWKVLKFGLQTYGTILLCPTWWKLSEKVFNFMERGQLGRYDEPTCSAHYPDI